jgi:hypothetical protein
MLTFAHAMMPPLMTISGRTPISDRCAIRKSDSASIPPALRGKVYDQSGDHFRHVYEVGQLAHADVAQFFGRAENDRRIDRILCHVALEVVSRTWRTASKMKEFRGPLKGEKREGVDNERVTSSWRTSSAATVSARMRDSAKAMSSAAIHVAALVSYRARGARLPR